MKKKVMIAMSGGVDSSTAAALLKAKGFSAIGLTMCLGIPAGHNSGKRPLCCSAEAIADARKVCLKLDMPHYVFDFKKILKEKVIDNFIDDYLKARTPNPCVRCNRYLKFDLLLNKARALGMDYLATGHYAKVVKRGNRHFLKKAKDKKKDQSYFLYGIKKANLPFILFPLENLTKEATRDKARHFDLPVSSKPASQEICFVSSNDYKAFLKEKAAGRNFKIEPGDIVDRQGKVLGRHKGICFYTIGQREGLRVSAKKPLYVIALKAATNTVVVGFKEDTFSKGLIAGRLNLFIGYPKKPFRAKVKIRYNQEDVAAEVFPYGESKLKIVFKPPQSAVTPGQSVVIYDRDILLGGGVIERTIN
jgi:tRNA-specific 2-thiouridylase